VLPELLADPSRARRQEDVFGGIVKIALAFLIFIFPLHANAQVPAKPVRVVVGYAPGSSTDIQAVVALPGTREKLQGAGVSLFEDNQAGFRRFFLADIGKWRDLVKKTNLKLE
jgi:hypothetical protein